MAWSQADIDTLKAAIARGVRRVAFTAPGGVRREQEFASLAEMRAALAMIENEVLGTGTGVRRHVGRFVSGL